MSSGEFYEAPQEEQVRRLESLARSAVEQWALGGARILPIAYRENMTFEVDAGAKGRFALRVHQAGYRTDAEIQSELDFMEYLHGEGILTPQVVRAASGASFVHTEHRDVPEPRQCDLFEWIDGRPLRKLGEPVGMSPEEVESRYREVGRLAAGVYNASEKWTQPRGFDRPAWDAEGIFGKNGHLGDFRRVEQATRQQRELLEALANRLREDLDAFGEGRDRYGLSQGDLLPENIMLCDDGMRLIDFDDVGESWILFDVVTSVWDLKLLGSELYDPCLHAVIDGFRELRSLPDEHLALLPGFLLARVLSYLAHTVSRSHLEASRGLQPVLLSFLEAHGQEYLRA